MVQGTASEHKAAMVYRDPELGQLEFWMSCDRVILVGWIGQRVRARGLRREAVIKKSPCPWYSRYNSFFIKMLLTANSCMNSK